MLISDLIRWILSFNRQKCIFLMEFPNLKINIFKNSWINEAIASLKRILLRFKWFDAFISLTKQFQKVFFIQLCNEKGEEKKTRCWFRKDSVENIFFWISALRLLRFTAEVVIHKIWVRLQPSNISVYTSAHRLNLFFLSPSLLYFNPFTAFIPGVGQCLH